MGEHKLPKPAPQRPSVAIFSMTNAVTAFQPLRHAAEEDERQYMDDMKKLLDWIAELEAATDPFAAIVPAIPATATDEQVITLHGPGLSHEHAAALTIPIGAFRRLNPEALKPKLDS